MKSKRNTLICAGLAILFPAAVAVWQLALFGEALPTARAADKAQGEDAGHDDHAADAVHADHDDDDEHAGHADEDEHADHDDEAQFEIKLATAGPGKLATEVNLPGEVVLNADRLAHIVPQAPGIVREVKKKLGDTVRAGDIMAILESPELGEVKVQYLSRLAELTCCSVSLTRMQAVRDNTLKLMQMLKTDPSLEQLMRTNGSEMGENRSLLVSGYAELVFAKATYLREKGLYGKKISSAGDFPAAENEYKKADAHYNATRDSIAFAVERDLRETRQERRVAEFDLKAAERRLHILGLTAADIKALELLAQSQAPLAEAPEECTDPDCADCRRVETPGQSEGAEPEKLAWYALRAPFDGTVIEKHITLGERLDEDADVFTVADLGSVWVDLSVYQKHLPYVKAGQKVSISAGDGVPEAEGTVAYVAPIVDRQTRTALARVVLPNPDGHMRPGLFVTARVTVGEDGAQVLIPKDAIQTIDGESVVFVPEKEGFAPRPITTGRANKTHIEVLVGLVPGQRYVVEGAFELKAKIITSGLDPHAGHGH
ncbi:MAG: efflux RND transporter periplasmic adaptor subunit [Planctomycetes bacterium]|nr:efflux RND transporter periplasmic adaptor subunit [Planctomycetota bacterium]